MEELFVQHILSNYHHYCVHNKNLPSTQNFVKYLILHNVIERVAIRHYVLLEEYHRLYAEGTFPTKGKLISFLSQKYLLHQSSVWMILKEHKTKFYPQIPNSLESKI